MFKKIQIVLGVLAVIVVVFLGVVALQPADFTIVRTATIDAPPSKVFEQVNDFHNWDNWSPWAKLDPKMTTTFEGPSAGKGAKYAWVGNDDVGEGRMTLTESRAGELVRINLEFLRPMQSTSVTEFTFKAEGKQTVVAWSMSGRKGFVEKAFCMFMNMDKLVGGDFEKGLAQLKTVAEGAKKG